MAETITGYSFRPADLKSFERRAGISAFMRIRNGADFLERTILSHAAFFDEIVAVYNQCSDDTPSILERMAGTLGPKLRVFHYADRVFPPGSTGHAETPPDSPNSMVNYSNFALAMTSMRTVTKLDDDHLAIPNAVRPVVEGLRRDGGAQGGMLSFSGINLIARLEGGLAIPAQDPISGTGDIGFFDVTPETFFTHDRRFERVPRPNKGRRFCGFLYWHLKYLKAGLGFGNYELAENEQGRFARRKAKLERERAVLNLAELRSRARPGLLLRGEAIFLEKKRMALERDRLLPVAFPDDDLEGALRRTVDPTFLAGLV